MTRAVDADKANRTGADEAALVATALDYFEGWFDGDTDRMDRALHPALAKRSPAHADTSDAIDSVLPTVTKERMLALTAAGEGRTENPGGAPIDVQVLDVHRDIATLVVRSALYREYLHLVRRGSGWQIVNALWDLT
jgi:hypothetical protein